ncbi:MAG: hypothetical protein GY838_13795 [bacterium]|nr:hypothetical protein [bacterium]
MRTTIILAALLAASGCAAAERHVVDGVLHVRNDARPRDGVRTIELEEQWRVGGDEDEVFFGLVNKLLVADDGTLFLLDSRLAHVEVFGPDGVHLRTIGRRGEGPGEFNLPLDMVLMEDGSLAVSEGVPGRIKTLSREGVPGPEILPRVRAASDGGRVVLVNLFGTDNGLVITGQDVSTDTATGDQFRTYFTAGLAADGAVEPWFHRRDVAWNLQRNFADEDLLDYAWERVGAASDGRVVVGESRNGYALTVYRPDGAVDRVIEKEYSSWRRDDRARRRCQAWLDGIAHQLPGNTETRMLDTEPDILQLFLDDADRIWVLDSRARWTPRPGVLAAFDVFTLDGEYIERVEVRCEGRSDSDRLVFGPDGLVFRITGYVEAMLDLQANGHLELEGEAAPMEVVCYRRTGS